MSIVNAFWRHSFSQNYGEEVTGEQLHEILKEIDTNMNGQVELDEYLQVYTLWCVALVNFCC